MSNLSSHYGPRSMTLEVKKNHPYSKPSQLGFDFPSHTLIRTPAAYESRTFCSLNRTRVPYLHVPGKLTCTPSTSQHSHSNCLRPSLFVRRIQWLYRRSYITQNAHEQEIIREKWKRELAKTQLDENYLSMQCSTGQNTSKEHRACQGEGSPHHYASLTHFPQSRLHTHTDIIPVPQITNEMLPVTKILGMT